MHSNIRFVLRDIQIILIVYTSAGAIWLSIELAGTGRHSCMEIVAAKISQQCWLSLF
jgi:hypothetical protein